MAEQFPPTGSVTQSTKVLAEWCQVPRCVGCLWLSAHWRWKSSTQLTVYNYWHYLLFHCPHPKNFTIPQDSCLGRKSCNKLYCSFKELKDFSLKFSSQKSHLAVSPVLNYFIIKVTQSQLNPLHWKTCFKQGLKYQSISQLCPSSFVTLLRFCGGYKRGWLTFTSPSNNLSFVTRLYFVDSVGPAFNMCQGKAVRFF